MKPHVIFVGCPTSGEKWGGTRTYTESLTNYLKNQGYEYSFIPDTTKVKGSMSCLAKIKIHSMKSKFPENSVAIAQRPDDLYIFQLFQKKIPSICVLHGDNLRKMKLKRNKFTYNLYRKMEVRGLRAADKIVCVDNGTQDAYVKRYPWIKSKSEVIPVGVDTNTFRPLDKVQCRSQLNISNDKKVMLVAARLEKEKNVAAAIRLFLEYFDTAEHCLLIAGAGKEKEGLKKLAKGAEQADIKFLGQVPYPKLPIVINAADVVLVPSLFESGPLIIIESMACGVPTVSTDVGRAREFLEDSDCGYVVGEVNQEFASMCEELIKAHVRDVCMERVILFSFDNTGERTIALIKNLV